MNTVYVKSEKAVKEFEVGNRSLSLKHRQLLIMVNGRRTGSDISRMFNSESAVQMLIDLEKLGYLIPAGSEKIIIEREVKTGTIEPVITQEHLVFIKTFLIEEARLQLGLMSREVEKKISAVENPSDLKSCIARWHMAIRDSRNGHTIADRLMGRLAHLMANPLQALTSEKAS